MKLLLVLVLALGMAIGAGADGVIFEGRSVARAAVEVTIAASVIIDLNIFFSLCY